MWWHMWLRWSSARSRWFVWEWTSLACCPTSSRSAPEAWGTEMARVQKAINCSSWEHQLKQHLTSSFGDTEKEECGEYKPRGGWRSGPAPWLDMVRWRSWRNVLLKWSPCDSCWPGWSRWPGWSHLSWGRAAWGLDADWNREAAKR